MVASPLVSVVVVSWNARNYLSQCLGSLTAEVCAYLMEIIVVDNNSSDGSPEMVEQEFPHVRLIREAENLGFAKANNIGIRESSGKYVALINSDVRVLKDCLTYLVDFADAHPEVGMVGPRIIGGDGKLQRSCKGFPTLWNMFCRALALDAIFRRSALFGGYLLNYRNHDELECADILSGCFWLARKDALDKVGLLDESFFMYGEDMDWCKRFWDAGWKLMFVPTAEVIHYGGASSSNAPLRFFIEKLRADFQYWRKHHSRIAVAFYFLITSCHLILRIVGYLLAFSVGRESRQSCRYKVQRSLAGLKWMMIGCPKTSNAV
jgi:GT2 family glycosyltransferase